MPQYLLVKTLIKSRFRRKMKWNYFLSWNVTKAPRMATFGWFCVEFTNIDIAEQRSTILI